MADFPPFRVTGVVLCALLGACAGCQPKSKETPEIARESEGAPSRPLKETVAPTEDGFQRLTLGAFEIVGGKPGPWTTDGNVIHCSGKPRGYCYTKTTYHNFCLRLDYQFPRPADLPDEAKYGGNTGVLIYITGKPKVWPVCLEVQGKFSEMGTIKENGGARPVEITDHDDVRQSARKPVGEWNSLEIVSEDGALTATLNGSLVCQSRPGELNEGAIGLQSEGFEVHFRNVRIQER